MAGGTDTIDLVVEVSEAGGLGILGALMLSPSDLRAAIHAIRSRTSRPFGVNLVLHPFQSGQGDAETVQRYFDRYRQELGLPSVNGEVTAPAYVTPDHLRIICEECVPVLNTMGDPAGYIEPAHAAGVKIMPFVSTVEEARRAVALGADAVVAQGSEAGGLRATFAVEPGCDPPLIGSMALIPQVVDAVSVPVIAAGGIMDGRGVLAALALGASGVMLGTRFSLARESGASASWRSALSGAAETDVVLNRVATGRPARSLRNRLIEEFDKSGLEPLAFPYQFAAAADIHRAAMERDRADLTYLAAGQGIRMAKHNQTAGEIVAEIVADASSRLDDLHSNSAH